MTSPTAFKMTRDNDNDNATTTAATATAITTMATTLAPNDDNRGSRRDEVCFFSPSFFPLLTTWIITYDYRDYHNDHNHNDDKHHHDG